MNKLADQNSNSGFTFGPFKKDSFQQEVWEDFKQKVLLANATQEDNPLMLQGCEYIFKILSGANESPNHDTYFGDPSIKNFFFKRVFPPIIKKVLCENFNDDENLPILYPCLLQILIFWVKTLYDDHSHLGKMAKTILNPYCKYYNKPISSNKCKFEPEMEPKHLDWLGRLKKGDIIDCMKVEPDYKKMDWCHGLIDEITEVSIKISFLGDVEGAMREFDKKLHAHEIAPYKTKYIDSEWRMNLQKDDQIYVYKKKNTWILATVIDTMESRLENGGVSKKVKIGYRIYSKDGKIMSPDGRRYSGWSPKSDEWLYSTNPRIEMRNSTKSMENNPFCSDDSNDIVIQGLKGKKKVYAVLRSNYCDCVQFIELVNEFGNRGGFERIYQRIADKEIWAPIKTVYILCSVIGKLAPILHKEFASEYIPKLQEAVWKNLLNSPEWNLKDFSKIKIDKILNSFDSLLGRRSSPYERKSLFENFKLQIILLCFDSEHLSAKLCGLFIICQFIEKTKADNPDITKSTISSTELNNFLTKNSIFMKICHSKYKTELLKNSQGLVKYMFFQDLINLEHFELLCFIILNENEEAKLAVYDILRLISSNMMPKQCEYFVSNILKIPRENITKEDIKFLLKLVRNNSIAKLLYDFYYQAVSDDNNNNLQLIELALYCLSEIVQKLDHLKLDLVDICFRNIRHNISLFPCLKIINHMLNEPDIGGSLEAEFFSNYRSREEEMIYIIIAGFNDFKSKLKEEKINRNSILSMPVLDSAVGDNSTYNGQIKLIKAVLGNLYQTILPLKEKAVHSKVFFSTWDILVKQSMTAFERSSAYDLLFIILCNNYFEFDGADLARFFKENNETKQFLKFEQFSHRDFDFFEYIFGYINQAKQTLNKISPSFYEHQEYIFNAPPNTVEGIDILWGYISIPSENEATKNAMNFINLLYSNSDSHFESQHIKQHYFSMCNKYLQETLEKRHNLKPESFVCLCLRYLKLINNAIDYSEKNGIGEFQTHFMAEDRNEITFVLHNQIPHPFSKPAQAKITIDWNSTAFELGVEVAKIFRIPHDLIILENSIGCETFEFKKGRTLRELKLGNKINLKVLRKEINPKKLLDLLQADGSLNPLVKRALVAIFEEYSENGKMSPEFLAKYIHACIGDTCQINDSRVKGTFELYAKDRNNFLSLENFLELYQNACKTSPYVVWENLYSQNFNSKFQKGDEAATEKIDLPSLLRYRIGTDNNYFQTIYSLLDLEDEISLKTLELLDTLPTNPNILINIVDFGSVGEQADSNKKDWDTILDIDSKAKLLYSLQIIDILTMKNSIQDKRIKQIEGILLLHDPRMLEKIKTWKVNFIQEGGIGYLLKIIQISSGRYFNKTSIIDSKILSYCFKILNKFLVSLELSSAEVQNNQLLIQLLYNCLTFLRKHLNRSSKSSYNGFWSMETEDVEGFKNLSKRLNNEFGIQNVKPNETKTLLEVTMSLWYKAFPDTKKIILVD